MDIGLAAAGGPPADRCPGVLHPFPAGDGGLVRVRTPGGRVTAGQIEAIGAAAAFGNGIVELTSRANVQLRGVTQPSAPAVEAALRDAGLLPSRTHERVRNIIASPLAGRHPSAVGETDAIVATLDRALCANPALAELPGRFLFAVDDGSGTLDASRADVGLGAESGGSWRLWLAGRPTDLAEREAVGLALAAATAFLAVRPARAWRIADLEGGGPQALAARLGGKLTGPRKPGRPPGLGAADQADGRIAVTVLAPLGRLDASMLAAAARLGSGEVRLSTRRTLTFLDCPPDEAATLTSGLAAAGFVVAEPSGWWGLSACAGIGACANAHLDVRAAASMRARRRGPGSPSEHWAACARGCGRPPDAGIAVTAAPDGLMLERSAQAPCLVEDVRGALAELGRGS